MNKYLLGITLALSSSYFLIGSSFASWDAKIIIDQTNKKILIQSGDQKWDIDSFSGDMLLPLKLPSMWNPTIPEKVQPSKPSSSLDSENPQKENTTSHEEENPKSDPDLHAELPSGTELEKAVFRMHKNGLTSFDTLESYRPKDPLLREEAAKIITQAYIKLGYPQEQKNQSCDFSDKENFNPTLSNFIAQSCAYGIFKGAEGKFLPHKSLTKAEALTVLMRIFEGNTSNESLTPRWTMYFIKAKAIFLTNEKDVNALDRPITREEIALLIYRFKKLILDQQLLATAKTQLANVNQNPTSFLQNQLSEKEKNEEKENKSDAKPSSPLLDLLSWSKDSSSSLSILNNPEITEAMHRMRESKLTSATDISTYRAFDPLTREQTAKMLVEFAKLEGFWAISGAGTSCKLKDLNKADPSLRKSIEEVCKLWLMQGGNGYFNPKTNIAKTEFLALLIRLSEGKYLDETQQPRWSSYFLKAKELWLINNDDALSIESPMTRYEAALIFYRFWIKHKILSNLNTAQLKNELISTIKNSDGSFIMLNEKNYAVSIDSNLLKNQFFQEGFIEILGQRYRLKKTNITTFDIGNESFVWYGDLFEISSENKVGNVNFIVSNSNIIDGSLRLIHQAKNWKIKPDTTTTARYQLIAQ